MMKLSILSKEKITAPPPLPFLYCMLDVYFCYGEIKFSTPVQILRYSQFSDLLSYNLKILYMFFY